MKRVLAVSLLCCLAACGGRPVQAPAGAGSLASDPSAREWRSKSDEYWRAHLTPEQYRVSRKADTERAFTGAYWNNHAAGEYRCVACDLPLFSSETKYESGTGWPSFWRPLDERNIEYREDKTFFMVRTEVRCSRCGGHLGHVFDDGPPPTGKRYCLNSAALKFYPKTASR